MCRAVGLSAITQTSSKAHHQPVARVSATRWSRTSSSPGANRTRPDRRQKSWWATRGASCWPYHVTAPTAGGNSPRMAVATPSRRLVSSDPKIASRTMGPGASQGGRGRRPRGPAALVPATSPESGDVPWRSGRPIRVRDDESRCAIRPSALPTVRPSIMMVPPTRPLVVISSVAATGDDVQRSEVASTRTVDTTASQRIPRPHGQLDRRRYRTRTMCRDRPWHRVSERCRESV